MTDLHTCPTCNGAGEFMAHHNTGLDSSKHYWDKSTCSLCKGAGLVPARHINAVEKGLSLRTELRDAGITMYELHKVKGISPAETSSVFTGRIHVDDWSKTDVVREFIRVKREQLGELCHQDGDKSELAKLRAAIASCRGEQNALEDHRKQGGDA